MIRAISHTEQSTLLTCQAKWDFKYGGYLAGTTLRPKAVPIRLQEGKAWGAGVAAFHAASEDKLDTGIIALTTALDKEAAKLELGGFYDKDDHLAMASKLRALLEQYAEEEDDREIQLAGLSKLEHELMVPLPSRSGKGDSSRYRLQVFFDGVLEDADGRIWLVEFKLRGKLSPLELITNSRQIRYYAWAWQREFGLPVAGVIVDERLNEQPKPARWVKPKKKDEGVELTFDEARALGAEPTEKEIEKAQADSSYRVRRTVSHAKDQVTTPESYLAACERAGVEPDAEALAAITGRRWSLRERVFLTSREIEESGTELVSLGRQVAAIDSGQNYPVRNVKPQNCNGCDFREICNQPHDSELIDALFDRRPAKRDLPDPSKEAVPA